ncbi:MAG: 4-hydroxy-tetrahydrodipicolinate synthase [Firmicutes bacterium]|nr:4-hydroxy-tetrahydrodipicolinate synthase [[Eubacterium] siraeum]MCM1488757.1 4-hydroxy-tetrahydrodipicolinate synthase [Bacillota bacterium]
MKNTIFTGAAVAVITPMNKDGSVNYGKLGELIDDQINAGTDGIVICGTTGESSTLTDEEHIECIRFAVKHTNGRVPVIAGTGSNDTAYAAEMSKDAEKAGADALLLVTPYYNKTSQRGLVAHFTAIADAVNIPIILYNVPSRTGCKIEINTYKELAKHKNIVAAKEACGDISLVAQLAAETDLDIYSGNDDQVVPIMSLGGKGVISVASHLIPKEMHDMAELALKGDYKKAAELQLKYLGLIKALFCDVNPIPVKEAMNIMGKNVGECRLPLYKMEQSKIDLLTEEMKKAGII